MAEPSRSVEFAGVRYRVGHNPSGGYHIQRQDARGHWSRAWSRWNAYFGDDRAAAEQALARLAEVGSPRAEGERSDTQRAAERVRAADKTARRAEAVGRLRAWSETEVRAVAAWFAWAHAQDTLTQAEGRRYIERRAAEAGEVSDGES